MPTDAIHIRLADYGRAEDAFALVSLIDAYACDPAGGGQPLSEFARANLVCALAARPQAFSVLAFDGDLPVGLINCFEGFSTFACRPLVNMHDVVVLASHRGRRLGELMLTLVESVARERGACKLTLEVLDGNHSALKLYARNGFSAYQLDPVVGDARFLEKKLV